jgi:hypothetical protein
MAEDYDPPEYRTPSVRNYQGDFPLRGDNFRVVGIHRTCAAHILCVYAGFTNAKDVGEHDEQERTDRVN